MAAQNFDVLSLSDISYRLKGVTATWQLQELIDDETIVTPEPEVVFNGKKYWKEDSLEDWQKLIDLLKEIKQWEDAVALEDMAVPATRIVENLLEDSRSMERRNARAYKGGRNGYSISDARERIVRFRGAYQFVNALLGTKIPEDVKKEIGKNISLAESHIGE